MAEDLLEEAIPNAKNTESLVKQIFRLIEYDSLDDIKKIFETFDLEQRISIVNTSINGLTLLFVAVNYNNARISRYLIDISLPQGSLKMSDHWKTCHHPLFAAMFHGNSELIELFLSHLASIDDYIDGANTPLMIAAFIGNLVSVKLIVAKGADVNRSCFQGRNPLMESTSNSEICKFLLSQGANANHQDEEGSTALHIAVAKKHVESINDLLIAGADVRIRNHEDITPLVWATTTYDIKALNNLIHQFKCSVLETIEIFEILNACKVCAYELVIEPWKISLQKRWVSNLPKRYWISGGQTLDYAKEFTLETELEDIKNKPIQLAYQGLLVIERILGRNNRLYLRLLLQTASTVKKRGPTQKVKQFVKYIQKCCVDISVFSIAANFCHFKSLFNEFGEDSDREGIFGFQAFLIFKIIADAAVKMWRLVKDNVYRKPLVVDCRYSDLVYTFLYMASTIYTKHCSPKYHQRYRDVMTNVVREDLRFRLHLSILHRAIKLLGTEPWGSLELIKALLEYGADPNCQDYFGRNPMMYAIKYVPENIRNQVLNFLVFHGGRSDVLNRE